MGGKGKTVKFKRSYREKLKKIRETQKQLICM